MTALQDAERAQLIADLKAARAELVARGRCRRQLVGDGRVCAMGAVGAATVDGFVDLPTEDEQFDALHHSPRAQRARTALEVHTLDVDRLGAYGGVMLFNDHPTTTDLDVLDLFDKTIFDLGGAL